MSTADGRTRRARHAALVRAHPRPVTTAAVALLALIAASCSDAPDDAQGVTDIATASSDEADPASGDDAAGDDATGDEPAGDATDESDLPAPEQGAGEDDDAAEPNQAETEEIDPFDELEWALTPAGPGSPSVNEDSIYKVLDDLDPQRCQALLADDDWFDPSSFGTGERSVHLFRAGALLCAGDRAAAETAYRRALDFAWTSAVTQPLHSRVCNVWDAVTRMVDPGAGPCALEELPVDDTTETNDDARDDLGPETERDAPTDTEGTADPDAPNDPDGSPEDDDSTDADDPPVVDDSADALSDDDGGS